MAAPLLHRHTRRSPSGPGRTAACLLLLLVSASCSGGDPTGPLDDDAPGPVAAIQVAGVTIAELPGEAWGLTATAVDAAGRTVPGVTFTWTSSDEAVAAVGPDGRWTARGLGTATVSVQGDGATGSADVTVTGVRSLAFLEGSWRVSVAGEDVSGERAATVVDRSGVFEEVRAGSDVETVRVLTRLSADGESWWYGRADGERGRMQFFRGMLREGENRAVALSARKSQRVVVDQITTEGFRVRLQTEAGGVWEDLQTETYLAGDPDPAASMGVSCGERAREFDFWLGEWTVTNEAGTRTLGSSSVTQVSGGCAVRESWTGSGGGLGWSLNMYDLVRDEWTQVWMSPNGAPLHLNGGLQEDGSMRLSGVEDHGELSRITWTPLADGRIRQHWERASPDGNWTTAFLGYYSR